MERLSSISVSTFDSMLTADAQRSAELMEEAIRHYEDALRDVGTDADSRLELTLKLADCYQKTSQCDRVILLLEGLAQAELPAIWRARVLTRVGWAKLYLGDIAACVRDCSQAVSVLNPTHFHDDLALAARRLGYAFKWQGLLLEAETAFRDAVAASRRGTDREQMGLCLHALGNLNRQRGRYDDAVTFHRQSLSINVELGARSLIAKDLFSIGLAALYAGEWKQVLEALEQAKKISEELSHERGLLLVDLTLCRLHRRRGEHNTARELALRALQRAQETSDARAEVLSREELGDLAREASDLEAARRHYDEAWESAKAIAAEGDLVYELAWRRALLALDAERAEEAEGLARQAQELAERSGDVRESANALRTLAQVRFRRGSPTEALAHLEDALGRARSIQAPFEVAEMHEAFAELVAPRGPLSASAVLAHLFEARRIFTNLGARAAASRVEREIARLEELALDDGASGRSLVPRPARDERHELIARDSAMIRLIARARELGATDSTVLLQGATGTGKELLARLIHESGPRRRQPFVPLNCAALPTHLLESELFGHRRGSFTGADQDRVGLFASAGEGTVFLDEIDKAPPEFQTKLLRVIEDRRVRPVGATREITIHARVLCATNRDLRELADGGRFLPDLYYRLNAFRLVVPPLRERPEDLWALVEHYLATSAARFGATSYTLTKDARTVMTAYEWPGNVRELRNVLEAAAFFARDTGVIDRDDLPAEILGATDRTTTTLDDRIEKLERREITLALRRSAGNKTLAAQMLGVSRKGLLDRLHRLGMLPA